MDRTYTRRTLLRGLGTTLGAGALAGCVGALGPSERTGVERYVVAFHWGFRLLAPDGTVTDHLTVDPGTRVALHAVNLEPIAEGAEPPVPEPVARTVTENYEAWEAGSLDRIAPSVGLSVADLETKLDGAESAYGSHAVVLRGPGGSRVGDAYLPAAATEPETVTVRPETPGAYDLECQLYCGFGHSFMAYPEALVVE